jgi:hypothetical protein
VFPALGRGPSALGGALADGWLPARPLRRFVLDSRQRAESACRSSEANRLRLVCVQALRALTDQVNHRLGSFSTNLDQLSFDLAAVPPQNFSTFAWSILPDRPLNSPLEYGATCVSPLDF